MMQAIFFDMDGTLLPMDLEGFTKYPRNSSYCLNLRETVNQKIKELL